jgi:hypothetical protein
MFSTIRTGQISIPALAVGIAVAAVSLAAQAITTRAEVGSIYLDPGATATDNYDGDLTARIVTVSAVNTSKVGAYTVTYAVTDSSGNAADPVVRIVQVVDTTPPVTTLVGEANPRVQVDSAYTDPGATATDNYDGDITSRVTTSGHVDTAKPGVYTLTYSVSDAAGNAAAPVVRTVTVYSDTDTTKPVITLLGAATMTIGLGSQFVDPGATATDAEDGDLTSQITQTGTVDVSNLGAYTITYNVSDAAGNAADPVVRTVKVADMTKPVIRLLGNSYVTLRIGRTYVDAGATASDNVDGDLTSKIVTTSKVNTRWPGTYYVTYNVKDAAGNAADTVYRSIRVTFFAKSDTQTAELLIASPLEGSTYYASAAETMPLTLTAYAPDDTASVAYTLDGEAVGSSDQPPYTVVANLAVGTAAWGEHRVGATARMRSSQETLSAESTFTLAPVASQDDANGNGIPDNPFVSLAVEGDTWVHAVAQAKNAGPLMVGMTRFEGAGPGDPDAPVVLAVARLNDPSQAVLVTVPRDLLDVSETGLVLVALSDRPEALLGSDGAARLGPQPAGYRLIPGGEYIDISVLTTRDGGITFDEVDAARLATNPVHLVIEGLSPTQGYSPLLYTHPVFVDSDAVTGIFLEAQEGEWTAAGIRNVAVSDAEISTDLTSLSIVAPYEKEGPASGQDDNNIPGCAAAALNTTSTGNPFRGGRGGDTLLMTSALAALLLLSKMQPKSSRSRQEVRLNRPDY